MSATPAIRDIIAAIEARAPLSLQQPWDNSGVQVGATDRPCSGVLTALDPTPAVIAEARARGCNLVVTHHPLLFKGLKQIVPGTHPAQQAVIDAIAGGITVYASHTPLDSAPGIGLSHAMACRLGATVAGPLEPIGTDAAAGLGVVATFDTSVAPRELLNRARTHAAMPASAMPDTPVTRIGICTGAGGDLIARAHALGCQAFITGEIRYHDYVDWGSRIMLIAQGHYESEIAAKSILCDIISEKFTNFAVCKSDTETNPIQYG